MLHSLLIRSGFQLQWIECRMRPIAEEKSFLHQAHKNLEIDIDQYK